jgi:hypothetical protein
MRCIKNIITEEKMGGSVMNKYRIIGWTNKDGSKEGVLFLEEFYEDISDLIPPNMKLLYDEVKYIDLPDLFPVGTYLGKQ